MNEQYSIAENELYDEKSIHHKYLSYIMNNIFMRADYQKILASYNSEDSAYAKGVLNLMYQGLEQIYGTTDFTSSDYPYHAAVIPGIVQLPDSDNFFLGIFAIDIDEQECLIAHAVSPIGFIQVEQQLDEMAVGFSVPCPCQEYGKLEERGIKFLEDFRRHKMELPSIEDVQEQDESLER